MRYHGMGVSSPMLGKEMTPACYTLRGRTGAPFKCVCSTISVTRAEGGGLRYVFHVPDSELERRRICGVGPGDHGERAGTKKSVYHVVAVCRSQPYAHALPPLEPP